MPTKSSRVLEGAADRVRFADGGTRGIGDHNAENGEEKDGLGTERWNGGIRMSEPTTTRQKIEIGGKPLRIAGVVIRLVELDRKNQAAFIVTEVDTKPEFLSPENSTCISEAT
jgi:hypothetical protein